MPEIRVYTTKNCPYCRMVKAFLDKHGIPYQNIDVGEDREAAREMIRLTNQYAVPVTVVDNTVIIGFDAKMLNELIETEEAEVTFDLMVLGAGPAGLTAAVYAGRELLETVVISENMGGQVLESWGIENYMGFEPIAGHELMKKFEEQARSLPAVHIQLDRVASLEGEGDLFVARTLSGRTLHGKSLIIATGKRPRWLGLPDEKRFIGHGLSVCPTCDAPLFQGRDVAVAGSGNGAVISAIELSDIARSVHLIAKNVLRAEKVYAEALKQRKNVTLHLNSEITALTGGDFLTGITIRNRTSGEESALTVEGLFVSIGYEPNTAFLKDFVALNDKGEIIVDCDMKTSREGVFAGGDVTISRNKQIVIAVGEGAKAALAA
ncbi:MAG TPA: FAD-dependent oxidoreductase, partial [Methanomicrobiales archaeon]|nr:FAD-dependent oxidoreductase [Methanomicrobiales archaeon]